jgi:predicted O-methyltransferase YrrM
VTNPFKQSVIELFRRTPATARLLALSSLQKSYAYLKEAGWYRSARKRVSVDAAGEPIPWYTYAAISFLAERTKENMAVFEYGSGNSTLWWARRVARVVSCEHDAEWYELTKERLPSNVEYRLLELTPGGDYSASIGDYGRIFDIVVVDGRDRVNCAKKSVLGLKPDGVVVWDNSDREEYREGYDFLSANGFRRVDFSGMGPINANGWMTSVFYRPDNCLGI